MNSSVKLFFMLVLFGFISCSKPPSGRIVSINDYKIHVKDKGTGSPTVIIEGGLGCGTELYDSVFSLVSGFTRVISYDHAGIGYSTRSSNQRTLPNYVKELRQLFEKEKISPPYILVGHSLGGFIIRYYAHLYPNDVAGLVFIDQPSEDWFEYIRTTHSSEDLTKFNKVFDPKQTKFKGVPKLERELYELNCDLIRGIEIPPQIPVRMLTATKFGENSKILGYHPADMNVWAEMQSRLLKGVLDAKQIITDKSGHQLQMTEPELCAKYIIELVEKYRNSK
jgi:pimeloyl-ACP methyl ester carboxylesterase